MSARTNRRYTLLVLASVIMFVGDCVPQLVDTRPLITISEQEMNLSDVPGHFQRTCVAVAGNGEAYVTTRHLVFQNGKNIVTTSSSMGSLTSFEKDSLLQIIDTENMKSLPFLQHSPVGRVTTHYLFAVAIRRGDSVQKLEIADFKDGDQGLQGVANDKKDDDQNVREALQPLRKWFHSLDTSLFQPVTRDQALCQS